MYSFATFTRLFKYRALFYLTLFSSGVSNFYFEFRTVESKYSRYFSYA